MFLSKVRFGAKLVLAGCVVYTLCIILYYFATSSTAASHLRHYSVFGNDSVNSSHRWTWPFASNVFAAENQMDINCDFQHADDEVSD